MNESTQNKPLLEVKNLKTYFFTEDGVVKAVDGVDFHVNQGEVLGLVGESGCGKSVTSLSIMRLLGVPGKVVDGEIYFAGQDLLKLPESEMVKMRGNRMSMIFQQPQSSLNPVFTVGDQVAEVLMIHQNLGKEAAWNRAVELLAMVGIPDPARKAKAFPHEMSGGQAQRVMIAMALALAPELLIADEPTTALDVTIQAQILDLIQEMREKLGTSVILITHDLGIIAEMAHRVAVMYAGRIVEEASVKELFENPMHPYTKGLIASIPILGKVTDRLEVIPGSVPNLINLPPGCRFAPRCRLREQYGLEICTRDEPELVEVKPGHKVRCWLYADKDDHRAPLSVA
ncbi:ABC transporter ATP-binding protein [Anaerolinea thermophila]|uniref:ABC transporter ATP-binding protein n=1 Tax=Anaerolinea thermophila (strain DSM 14523 / JCM 11388 / NBRC 100420 / UNI-1) TaxID=926569 RepID=E8MZ31_ANATU|nr:ABC transporter ATP-binding protein [Anaerolinea thermophila]BAJ62174.1 putative ABC transporter ATP-binding protein [Anaerolinea thermophila UNI-1]